MAQYRIIDADGHVMELDSELREFIGPPYNNLEWHQSYSFWPGLTMDGYLRSLRKPGGWAGGGTGPSAKDWLSFLDKNGIELTVLYPTQGLTHAAIQDRDWAICLARAYNDWLYNKFMAVSPRLVGVALLPVQDLSEAVKELRRCVNELGMVGAVLPAVAPGGRLYSGPEFYPLWEEGCIECGVGWVPYMMDRMDEEQERKGHYSPRCKLKPSEYIKKGNIFFAVEVEESALPLAAQVANPNALLWASDYPHERDQRDFSHDIPSLINRKDVSDELKRKIFWDNPLRFYSRLRARIEQGATPYANFAWGKRAVT